MALVTNQRNYWSWEDDQAQMISNYPAVSVHHGNHERILLETLAVHFDEVSQDSTPVILKMAEFIIDWGERDKWKATK